VDEVIFLFDRQTGRLLHRLTALDSSVAHLTFSPDGGYLAAGLQRAKGIRVWRLADRELVLRDPEYADDVFGLAFASDGRLAATSCDGEIRLYSAQWNLLLRKPAPRTCPFGLAFSPDGRQLAIGYEDKPTVSVLSAQSLHLEFEPDTSGITANDSHHGLSSVAWSADGQWLYAGGRYQTHESQFPIFR
jgi:WD40 repeat protein